MVMIYTLIRHLTDLLKDLEDSAYPNGNWEIPAYQEPLRQASFTAMREILSVSNAYYCDQNKIKLHKELISVGMDFNQRWDTWISETEFESFGTKTFHQMLLRFSKGIMKAWRCWLIDIF